MNGSKDLQGRYGKCVLLGHLSQALMAKWVNRGERNGCLGRGCCYAGLLMGMCHLCFFGSQPFGAFHRHKTRATVPAPVQPSWDAREVKLRL